VPATDWGWLVTPDELASWILHRDADLLVVNKPPFVVCHPSKHGPWSSLIGAAREYLGVPRLHMPSRLDRETSGVVVLTFNPSMASLLQKAIQERQVEKTYHAILCGKMQKRVEVEAPIGRDNSSIIRVRRWVCSEGQVSKTLFEPVRSLRGYTFVRATPYTGRLHQIRVHAAAIGHSVAGDKLYGPDSTLMLDFLQHGFAGRLPFSLPLSRQALHCRRVVFQTQASEFAFEAPLWPDLEAFIESRSA
jgi:23S rRNA pseudouridine1911/1915/1917 synthase